MKPYYKDTVSGITIYRADCREVLPLMPTVDVVITDPVWPNSTPELAGADDPLGLFTTAAQYFPFLTRRVVVHLGCDSDPRFLSAVPTSLPFFRACWLEYVRPHYKGRLLYTNDVAYVFGDPPPARSGAQVLPGRFIQHDSAKRSSDHPCPRQLQHVRWLVKWFAHGLILDPFMGVGTTLQAAKACGLPAIGIEIEERFCFAAVEALERITPLLPQWQTWQVEQSQLFEVSTC